MSNIMNTNFKSTVYFKPDGQIWEIEVDPFWRMDNPKEFEARPTTKYFLETEGGGLVECDKDKNIINMKTKDKIVERLLENKHITTEEAIVLLKETEYINPNPVIGPGIVFPTTDDDMVPYGEICSCNPKNGGSGICGCIMGGKMVPRGTVIPKIFNEIDTTNTFNFNKDCQNSICYCNGSCKQNKNG